MFRKFWLLVHDNVDHHVRRKITAFPLYRRSCSDLFLLFGDLDLSSAILGDLGAVLGHLGAVLGHLGAILGHIGLSWCRLGPSWGHLGPS